MGVLEVVSNPLKLINLIVAVALNALFLGTIRGERQTCIRTPLATMFVTNIIEVFVMYIVPRLVYFGHEDSAYPDDRHYGNSITDSMEMFFAVVTSSLLFSIATIRIYVITRKYVVGNFASKLPRGSVLISILYGLIIGSVSLSPLIVANLQASNASTLLNDGMRNDGNGDESRNGNGGESLYHKVKLISDVLTLVLGIFLPSVTTILLYVKIVSINRKHIDLPVYSTPNFENTVQTMSRRRHRKIANLDLPVPSNIGGSSTDRNSLTNTLPQASSSNTSTGTGVGLNGKQAENVPKEILDESFVSCKRIQLDVYGEPRQQSEPLAVHGQLSQENINQQNRDQSAMLSRKISKHQQYALKAVKRSAIMIVHVVIIHLPYVVLRIAGVAQKSQHLRWFATYILFFGITIMPLSFGILSKERRDIIREISKNTYEKLTRFFAIRDHRVTPDSVGYEPEGNSVVVISTIANRWIESDPTKSLCESTRITSSPRIESALQTPDPLYPASPCKSVMTLSINGFEEESRRMSKTKSAFIGRISRSELFKKRYGVSENGVVKKTSYGDFEGDESYCTSEHSHQTSKLNRPRCQTPGLSPGLTVTPDYLTSPSARSSYQNSNVGVSSAGPGYFTPNTPISRRTSTTTSPAFRFKPVQGTLPPLYKYYRDQRNPDGISLYSSGLGGIIITPGRQHDIFIFSRQNSEDQIDVTNISLPNVASHSPYTNNTT